MQVAVISIRFKHLCRVKSTESSVDNTKLEGREGLQPFALTENSSEQRIGHLAEPHLVVGWDVGTTLSATRFYVQLHSRFSSAPEKCVELPCAL